MKLLLVEDDAMIGKVMHQGLVQEGHVVDWARSAGDATMALRLGHYEMVLLDLGLPDGSGLEVLTDYRRGGGDAAVIIVTARDEVAERIAGLDAGADDFVTKPFDLDELGARMRAVQRRRHGRIDPLLVYGGLSLNPATKVCRLQGKHVSLSPREYSLLEALLESPGRVVSRESLEERLYGWETEIESNAVEVHIHHLRRKLGKKRIVTIRGVGYLLGDCR
ncbi:DNA-binding response regulator [Geothermobacter hydrogeniphilus]|uniref:DNA-binding response regulator n=1 Tax=Geothermobacter hydrogeniphilus TaxID=1969733 RepID=A0A2K2HB77_9BACT|nr:winged helix-turn-helix domain-containing protein [Geothermobacter hydrogeniphilus]PNU20517.1 DNA-binding response regulator [Geothermobacter hydrogeniphilus]